MSNYQIHHFSKLPSTNRYAKAHLDSLSHLSVILSDQQTEGYGRFQRPWFSPDRNNLYFSLVLKPDITDKNMAHLPNITQLVALVICDVLDDYCIQTELKWPNDVLAGGAKIAGILSETVFRGPTFKGYVLGVGINLNMQNEDFENINQTATSLNLLTGETADRDQILHKLLNAFLQQYPNVIQHGFSVIKNTYLKKISFLNQTITVNTLEGKLTGLASGFSTDGCLVLKKKSGETVLISAGDIEIH